MKCPQVFKTGEANAKAYLRTNNVIDENRTILNLDQFNRVNKILKEKGLSNYGINAEWFSTQTIDNKEVAIPNTEAFEAVDFINQVKYNGKQVDISVNPYIKQINQRNNVGHIQDHENQKKYNEAVSNFQSLQDGITFNDPSFTNNPNSIKLDEITNGLTNLVARKLAILKNAKNLLSETIAKTKENRGNIDEFKRLTKQSNDLKEHIEQLENDIEKIKKLDSRSPELIEPFIRYDLDRLDGLIKSNDKRDNIEAGKTIEFISRIGDFSSPETIARDGHPIYEYEELFNGNDFLFTPSMAQPFINWKLEAETYKRELELKQLNGFIHDFNNNDLVKKFYDGKMFTATDILAPMKDANYIDMMLMDIKSGIFGNNGSLAQAIASHANNVFEHHIGELSTKTNDEINRLLPKVEAKLRELGYGFSNVGVGKVSLFKGVKWTLFRQQYRNGDMTRNLASKYSPEYQDNKNFIMNEFLRAFYNNKNAQGKLKYNNLQSAYRKRNGWINHNNLFINPSLLSELRDDAQFASIQHLFSTDINLITKHQQDIKDLVGETHYDKIIEEQKHKVQEYFTQHEIKVEELLNEESKSNINDLSEKTKNRLKLWDVENSPFIAAKYMENQGQHILVGTLQAHPRDFRYNSYVPLKQISGQETNYYDKNYETIENEPILKEFYDVAQDTLSHIYELLDNEDQRKLNSDTIPLQEKNFVEMFTQEGTQVYKTLVPTLVKLYDEIKNIMGVRKEVEVTSKMLDALSTHPEDEINKSFIKGNIDSIDRLFKVRASKFLSSYNNNNRSKVTFGIDISNFTQEQIADYKQQLLNTKLAKLKRTTVVTLTNRNINELKSLLAPYLRADDSNNFLKEGDNMHIGKILYNACQNEVIASHSFDLPKILKIYAFAVSQYAAQKELVPYMNVAKKYYESIKADLTTSDNKSIFNILKNKKYTKGLRNKANRQNESWYQRVILGNFGRNTYGITNTKLYNAKERELIKEMGDAIAAETDVKKQNELIEEKKKLGKNFAASGIVDELLTNTRFLALGFNLVSGINNITGGQFDNSMSAFMYLSNPDFINTIVPMEMMAGDLAGMLGKKHIPEKVSRSLLFMEKYDLLKDASNVLQKSSMRGAFSGLSKFSPYYALKKGEEMNQTPLNMAILKDTNITDKNGNENNVWDATYSEHNSELNVWELKLKDDFDTEENRKNWLEADGNDYNIYKARATSIITDTHGDYNPRGGMMAKDFQLGQMALMFRGWMARQYFVRFGKHQDRIDLGKEHGEDFAGRYWSHTTASFATHGAIVGTLTAGPVGAVVGAGIGVILNRLMDKQSTAMGVFSELYHINRLLGRKLMGFALNPIWRAGKLLTNTFSNANLDTTKNLISEDWDKLYKKMESPTFTQQDFNRYRSCLQEMAITCALIGLMLMSKAKYWDDDDKTEEGKRKRRKHNLLVNKFYGLANEITSYLDAVEAGKMLKLSIFKTINNAQKIQIDANELLQGYGVQDGKVKLVDDLSKMMLPNLFLSPTSLGFNNLEKRQYQPTSFDKYFWSDEKRIKRQLRDEKATRKVELESEYEDIDETDEQEVKKELRKEFPNKKKGGTYKDAMQRHKERQAQEKLKQQVLEEQDNK